MGCWCSSVSPMILRPGYSFAIGLVNLGCRSPKARMLIISDHTIVTSDSLGSVTFWDGASMAQKQHFSAHKADGMCLLIGPVSYIVSVEAELTIRAGKRSTPLAPTNESVNSHTSPHHLNSRTHPQNDSTRTMFEH